MSSVVAMDQGRMSRSEYALRVDLAAAFRLADRFGWSQLVWNHITARCPDNPEHFLINPLGVRWDEMTASLLVKVDFEGDTVEVIDGEGLVPKAGFVIHSGLFEVRPDVGAVVHVHTNDGVAVSALEDGLLPLSMEGLFSHDNLGCHPFEGTSMDTDERERLARSLGSRKAMILQNHGLLTVGASVGEAFVLMYWLERACEIWMKVLASNLPWKTLSREVCLHSANQEHEPRDITGDFSPASTNGRRSNAWWTATTPATGPDHACSGSAFRASSGTPGETCAIPAHR